MQNMSDLHGESRLPREWERASLVESPVRLLLILAVAIFLVEVAIMAFLHWFPGLPLVQEAVLDAFLLIVVLFPALTVFMYQPHMLQLRERRRAEAELQLERDKLKGILDSMEEGVFIVDPRCEIQYLNAALEKEFGPVGGRKCHEYFHGRTEPCPWCVNEEVFAGRSVRWEWNWAGTGRTYDLFDTPIRNADGTVSKLEIFHDITERKKAQEAIEAERRRLTSVLEGMPALVSLVGQDHSVRFANRYFRERFGEIDDKACHELHHGYEAPCPDCALPRVLESKRECVRETATRDGRIHRLYYYPFTDIDGSLLVLKLGIDITEQRRAEAAQRESEMLLRQLLDSNPSLMFIRDTRGVIRLANRALAQFYGVPLERLVGASQPEVHAAAGMDVENLNKSLREDRKILDLGKPLFTLDAHPLPDGSLRWYRTSRVPVILADGTQCVQVISGDISERVQAEQALREAHEELERRVEERTAELVRTAELLKRVIDERTRAEEEIRRSREELRNLSARLQSLLEDERKRIAREIHDELGQSLTALRLDLSLMAQGMWRDGLATSSRKAQDAARLVDTTLGIVKRVSAELRPGVLDELGLAAAIQWQAKEFQKRTGIPCAVVLDAEEARPDPELATALYRIFQESLTNVARHAMASRVDVMLDENDGRLVLEVRDNGLGVTETQLLSPTSLGLIGIRERVRILGGEVRIQGVPMKGTTVRVTIPRPERREADAQDPRR